MWGIVINLVESLVTLQSSFDLKLIQNDISSEGKRTFRHQESRLILYKYRCISYTKKASFTVDWRLIVAKESPHLLRAFLCYLELSVIPITPIFRESNDPCATCGSCRTCR